MSVLKAETDTKNRTNRTIKNERMQIQIFLCTLVETSDAL